jgi:hypothetical protein
MQLARPCQRQELPVQAQQGSDFERPVLYHLVGPLQAEGIPQGSGKQQHWRAVM